MEYTPHDRLFKELLTTFFVEFIELFLPEMLEYLDTSSLTALDKEIFTDVTSGESHEVDVLMQARFKGQPTNFLIHLENQAKSVVRFEKRMFHYFARLDEKYDNSVYPIVVFSYAKPQKKATASYLVDFPNKQVLKFKYDVIQLNRLEWRDYLARPNPVASALMAKMKIAPEERPTVKLECLKMLIGLKLDPARTKLISGFVGSYLKLNDQEQNCFELELAQSNLSQKEQIMEIVTDWTERGIEQGIEQGIVQGIVQGVELGKKAGAFDFLNRLLRRRFSASALSPALEEQITALSVAQIEELGEALLDFTQIEQLKAWLDSKTR